MRTSSTLFALFGLASWTAGVAKASLYSEIQARAESAALSERLDALAKFKDMSDSANEAADAIYKEWNPVSAVSDAVAALKSAYEPSVRASGDILTHTQNAIKEHVEQQPVAGAPLVASSDAAANLKLSYEQGVSASADILARTQKAIKEHVEQQTVIGVASAVGGAVISAALAPIVVPAVLAAVGFSGSGIVAGSIAVSAHAAIGNAVGGSAFAVLQSVGAVVGQGGALPVAWYYAAAGIGATVGGVTGLVAAPKEPEDAQVGSVPEQTDRKTPSHPPATAEL